MNSANQMHIEEAPTLNEIIEQVKQHHYFGSTAYNWATGATREEVIEKLTRTAGADVIKRLVKAEGGLYCWTCKVHAPQSATYDIEYYAPKGIPISDAEHCMLQGFKMVKTAVTKPYVKKTSC